ncbi:hypothetical protein FACS1894109_02510 [Spirochaetia bacterium]|nr:hypothetical protein FACS1894109_02510 [Spirochaetia bacterium]
MTEPGMDNRQYKQLVSLLNRFLDRFDWTFTPWYWANDLAVQEKNKEKRLVGVCYDACKYLAEKLTRAGIQYKSYWICGYGLSSIAQWFACQTLHSFNICRIPIDTARGLRYRYYFADCSFADLREFYNEDGERITRGFPSEKKALQWAAKTLLGNDPYMLREFDPLEVKMGSHILYSIRRMFNSAA